MNLIQAEKTLIEILINIRKKIEHEEKYELADLLAYEKILNKQLSTRRQKIIKPNEAKKIQEKKQIKMEQKIEQQIKKVIQKTDAQLKQVNELTKQTNSKNYHYLNKEWQKPPPMPPKSTKDIPKETIAKKQTKKETVRMPSIKKHLSNQNTKSKKQITGKITDSAQKKSTKTSSQSIQKHKQEQIHKQINSNIQVNSIEKAFSPKKEPQNIKMEKNQQIEIFQLQSFTNKVQLPQFEDIKSSNIRSYIQKYQNEELGYRKEQEKARLGYLKSVSKYSFNKRNVQNSYTDSIERKIWKGCDYIFQFDKFFREIIQIKDQLKFSLTKKTHITELFFNWLRIQKIVKNYQKILEQKSKIKAPHFLNLNIQYNPIKIAISSKQEPILLNNYLNGALIKIEQYLAELKQRTSLKKQDMKFLLELLNLVLFNSKKNYVVITKQQLAEYKDMIKN